MRVWKFENDVNTDEIIPGRYNMTGDPKDLAKHCFCEVRPAFPKDVKRGDLIVAGENFGCGSSREHAAIAIKASGIKCVIARSFARIFYRNAINIGLPILISEDAHERITEGDQVEVDMSKGEIKTGTETIRADPLPEFITQIVDAGGLISFWKDAS